MILLFYILLSTLCVSQRGVFVNTKKVREGQMKKFQTVGDLFQNMTKSEYGNPQGPNSNQLKRQFDARSFGSQKDKLEMDPDDDDIFSIHEQDNYSARFDVKTEMKEESSRMGEDQTLAMKTRPVSQLLHLRVDSAKQMKIRLDFIQPSLKKQRPPLHFQKFRHEDVWDPARQLRYKVSSDKICISNMVELPPSKHVLNKPKPYKPLQPLKKKMYRPPVPRVFMTGFDEFLSRRTKNKIGEIDLGVWNVQEVLDECYRHNVIPLHLYNQFINTNGHLQLRRYLEKWTQGELQLFDFTRTCFTLLDHRRLSQLLLHLHPQLYTLGSIEAFHPDVKEFIERTYYLTSDEYVQLYLMQDEVSECTWWSDIKVRVEEMKNDHYFEIKETIQSQPLPAELQYDKQKKSEYMRDLLGPLNIQDSQQELEKILSMKHKNNQQKFTMDESGNSYNRNEEDDQFQESHDRNTEMSFNQHSAKGQNSGTGQDWSKMFEADRRSDIYEED